MSEQERFLVRVKPNPNGCLDWVGTPDKDGYGRFRRSKKDGESKGKPVRVNRWVWEQSNGPIPAGYVVRHTCDRPSCVNIDHLLIGTHLDNVRDMVARNRHPSRQKTHCKRGHEFTEANTYIRKNGTRLCRTCHNDRRRKKPTN